MVTLLDRLKNSADKFHYVIKFFGHLLPTAKKAYDDLCDQICNKIRLEINELDYNIVDAKIDSLFASDNHIILIENDLLELINAKALKEQELEASNIENILFILYINMIEINNNYTYTIINEINNIPLEN
jgi:hypothetical protein